MNTNLPLADAPLTRDGIVIDCDAKFMHSRELHPDEIARARLKAYERKREALQQLRNDRITRAMSRAVNH